MSLSLEVRRANFPTMDQIRGIFPIDYIGHLDNHHYIYNGFKYSYPMNCLDPVQRYNHLKELRRYRDHFQMQSTMSPRDKEVRKKIMLARYKATRAERFHAIMVLLARNIGIIFISIVALKFQSRL